MQPAINPETLTMITFEHGSELADILRGVAVAMSSDDTRPHLARMHVEIETGRITLVATDGHRLHRAIVPCDSTAGLPPIHLDGPAVKALVKGAKSAKKISKRIPGERALQRTQPVTVRVTDLDVTITDSDGSQTRVRTLDDCEQFPPYEKVIPRGARDTEIPNGIGVNAAYLSEGADACALIVPTHNDGIRVRVGGELDPILVTAESAEGRQATAVIMPMRI